MKRIDELGISPMPWKQYDGLLIGDANKERILDNTKRNIADARLVASAPELYVCLCDAVTDFCKDCTHKTDCHDFFIPCPAKRWRRALAKASGEDVDHA